MPNKKHIKWTQDKIDFIIKKYINQEMNTYELAKYFGCSHDTIARRLKENNIIVHKFYEDLTNKRFGKLLVLGKSDKSNRRLYWNCLCDCGNIITIKGDLLRQYRQLSCGCINSKSEILIANLLRKNNISFKSQYTFDNLKSKNNKKLRFDFGIIKNNQLSYLIEYDGEQHFLEKVQNNNWNTLDNFYKIKERDQLKNQYCFQYNIPLIRIPYTHKDNIVIDDLLLETSKFILKKEDEKSLDSGISI